MSFVKELNVQKAYADLASYVKIDVRRPDEFEGGPLGHIRGARLLTLGEELARALKEMDKKAKYLFICRSGARSMSAAQMAIDEGFSDVTNMMGGMLEWKEAGYETEG